MGGIILFESFAGLTHVLASLFQLFGCLRHVLLVLGLLHSLGKLIGLTQQILLLITQPLQLPLVLLFFFLRFGFFQSRLQLRKLFVQVLLTPCQLTKPIEDLANLLLLLLLLARLLGLLLSFVTILVLVQLQIV